MASGSVNLVRKLLKAHMVFVTGITFSHDGKHVLSVSADASARITDVTRASVKAASERPGTIPGWAR